MKKVLNLLNLLNLLINNEWITWLSLLRWDFIIYVHFLVLLKIWIRQERKKEKKKEKNTTQHILLGFLVFDVTEVGTHAICHCYNGIICSLLGRLRKIWIRQERIQGILPFLLQHKLVGGFEDMANEKKLLSCHFHHQTTELGLLILL